MPLRHSDKPMPSWLLFCAGPMLVIFGLVFTSFAVLVQSQTSVFNAALTMAICMLLTWVGIQLTREYTWPSIKRAFGSRRDRTDGDT
jgi:uncharacterized membrane protein